MPDSSINLSLKYNGADVDNGTMPLADVVAALQGFAGAYGRVANQVAPESRHELRVTAVKQGSFELHIFAWLSSPEGVTALHHLKQVGEAAGYVFGIIKGYIEVRKHLKGDSYEIQVGDGNTRLIINRDGEGKEVPKEVIDLLQSRALDSDLKKVVAPLERGKIDTAEMKAVEENGRTEQISVDSSEREYFSDTAQEREADVTISGRLISNNKETLRGTFELASGKRFPYRYVGKHPELFSSTYAHRGTVRVNGTATLGEDGDYKKIEITAARVLQGELDFRQ